MRIPELVELPGESVADEEKDEGEKDVKTKKKRKGQDGEAHAESDDETLVAASKGKSGKEQRFILFVGAF